MLTIDATCFLYLTDPPEEVKITVPSGLEENHIDLQKGFGEYIFEASAVSYAKITCTSVIITWMSPTKNVLKSCQATGDCLFGFLCCFQHIV